jgi:heme/copper-type cytochrome/quinol oxidase subunit 2
MGGWSINWACKVLIGDAAASDWVRDHGNNGFVELVWILYPTMNICVMITRVSVLQCGVEDLSCFATGLMGVGNQWFWCVTDSVEPAFVYGVREGSLQIGDLRCLCVVQGLCLLGALTYRLTLSAADVIHAFALPVLGVKCDVVPGRCNMLGVCGAAAAGSLFGQCSEICGAFHGYMPLAVFSGVARPRGGCAGGAPVQGRQYICGWLAEGGLQRGWSLLIAATAVMK